MQAAVFDKSAKSYDVDFTHTQIGKLQRQRVYKYIFPLLNKNTSMLELNCGTGYDAVQLAGRVKSILATDISKEMINVAGNAIKEVGVKNVELKCCSIQDIKSEVRGKYDFVFSNFGGLNCLSKEEMRQFFKDIYLLMEPSSPAAFVLMSKRCWLENRWFALKKDKRKGRRNTEKGVKTTIEENEFFTYYYSPNELIEIAGDNFSVVKIKPIGLFIPPSYLNEQMQKRPVVFVILKMLDKIFGGISSLADKADHYLIVLKKR